MPTSYPSCPAGLEYLTQINQLLVKQKVELFEAFSGIEVWINLFFSFSFFLIFVFLFLFFLIKLIWIPDCQQGMLSSLSIGDYGFCLNINNTVEINEEIFFISLVYHQKLDGTEGLFRQRRHEFFITNLIKVQICEIVFNKI